MKSAPIAPMSTLVLPTSAPVVHASTMGIGDVGADRAEVGARVAGVDVVSVDLDERDR